jgi:hypothetical protein
MRGAEMRAPSESSTGECITRALRSRTAEWAGIDRRVPEPIAEAWKAIESATVLPRDMRAVVVSRWISRGEPYQNER